MDRAPVQQDPRQPGCHEQEPGRQRPLYGHQLQPGGHRRGLRAGLPGPALRLARLARQPFEPCPPVRQAGAAAIVHRHHPQDRLRAVPDSPLRTGT
ncbi:hypothetical protein G6F66_015398 [Rhizopus arrhizus]|nr:hypothetical protein G6F66_015398 [Rhizopus arrhizus]